MYLTDLFVCLSISAEVFSIFLCDGIFIMDLTDLMGTTGNFGDTGLAGDFKERLRLALLPALGLFGLDWLR